MIYTAKVLGPSGTDYEKNGLRWRIDIERLVIADPCFVEYEHDAKPRATAFDFERRKDGLFCKIKSFDRIDSDMQISPVLLFEKQSPDGTLVNAEITRIALTKDPVDTLTWIKYDKSFNDEPPKAHS